MLLHSAISPRPPLFQTLPISSSSYVQVPLGFPPLFQTLPISSYVQVPLGFRPSAAVLRRGRRLGCPARCSISKFHSYGTVDYERRPPVKWNPIFHQISTMEDPNLGAGVVLDRWEAEERRLSKWVVRRVARELRKFRRYKLALEVYNWMAAQGERFTFNSSDMAIKLDLIAKVYGISHAKEHFSNLPDTFKDKRTYGALLNVYGQAKMKDEAEMIFETMKSKGYATHALPFNVMMTLYMNVGEHEKVNMIVNELKEMNVTFDVYTYNIWITNCANMQDAEEMERVVGEMISDRRISANWTIYTTIAEMYTRLGNFERAECYLKDAENRLTGRDRMPFNFIIGLYGKIGKREEVFRIWHLYKSSFSSIINAGYRAMLLSLTKLGDMDGAEAIYEEWLSSISNYDPTMCNILISWYIRKGLVGEAKDVLDRFLEKGGKPKPITWELLAEGYISEKEVSEALLCIKAAESCEGVNEWSPKPTTIENLLELCKEKNNASSMDMLTTLLRDRGLDICT